MKILVFGRSGQVATELRRFEGVTCVDRSQADLRDAASCTDIINRTDADVVINAAAYTAVDHAEKEEAEANIVNGVTPAAMAQSAAARGLPFVHISTDYVFDGSGIKPWREDDPTGPLGAYGRTKLVGENRIQHAGGNYAILRTSWVFSAHGKNFVKTMLRLASERKSIAVVNDQIGGPTPARDIARACMILARALREKDGRSGIYHYAGVPDISWASFARAVFDEAKIDVEVMDIPSSSFPTLAHRPANSRLDCARIYNAFAIPRPDWRAGLKDVLIDLKVL
ncbi:MULTISPECIES: dTDP-4-dehydrorhamnose reductase [unclassified Rhizobium]|uniref:dTDP-4-dehydrorhamnose reductase n=1 Tax=unclassified Rhizobium TaxID=2613769 RepID=UPI001ADBBE76|nr:MULTISPECIES: dTDP-4-dehydrorhamnose reductase [unclassified Rhizobium]MBO9127835.1 dTDP-4-dehydrorhamnose reductase [Rhizobium sp. 16-488-2b]MBO9176941.1 dTDP-4-dehydrorhamnose reductase [Rhizobium sp. 16-488-2a]